ncbi:MAG TPA: amino acid ABC transporter permease [Acidobacteriaceae bacterium]
MLFVVSAAGEIVAGFLTTLELAVSSFALALVMGTLMATCRVSPVPVLRMLGAAYVEIVRNVPLFVILIFLIFGLPDTGLTLPLFACLVLGIGAYTGTYVCETIRSGILAVPRGEIEAARSLGFSITQILTVIVLPTAFRSMIQPLANIFISAILATALGASLGVVELTNVATRVQDRSGQILTTFVIVGAGYVVLTLSVGFLASWYQTMLTGTRRRF